LAQSGWGFTLPIIDSLSAQRAESIVGAIAFLFALLLGIASIAFVPQGVVAFGSKACAVAAAAVIVAAVTLSLLFVARWLRTKHNEASRLAILSETFDRFVKERKFDAAYIDGLRQTAVALFQAHLSDSDTPVHIVQSVATKLGRTLPDDVLKALDQDSPR
jgi:hypothetical protein